MGDTVEDGELVRRRPDFPTRFGPDFRLYRLYVLFGLAVITTHETRLRSTPPRFPRFL
jgi:hypothetical protein